MDRRVYRVVAKLGGTHMEYEIDYGLCRAVIYINPQKLNFFNFREGLLKCFKIAYNWEIDFPSFEMICTPIFSLYDLELHLRAVASLLSRERVEYKTKKKENPENRSFKFIGLEPLNSEITGLLNWENKAKEWSESPSNILTPDAFISDLRSISMKIGVDIEVLDWDSLKSKGLDLICAVGAAQKISYLVILREGTKPLISEEREKVALIGKGVCFDSGGLNLKGSNYICNMKFDMSGAAIAAASFFALAEHGYSSKKEVFALLPITENLIGKDAYRVDSVLNSFSGKTIEISNTDAEGRLLLADSISYSISTLNVDEIITISTLTGAIGYALGSKYAGGWSNTEDSWRKFKFCAEYSGDYIWRMPLDEYYIEDLRSGIADLKNAASTGKGGASRAAMFLLEFAENRKFIHLDIAGVSNSESKHNTVSFAPLFKTLYFYLKS